MIDRNRDATLSRQFISGLLWLAALGFAITWYFAIAKVLRSLPPTEPVAIGVITLEGVSKLRDYLGAAILYLFVPAATVGFHRAGSAVLEALFRQIRNSSAGARLGAAVLFAGPYVIAPMLYIGTRSEGRAIFFPILLSTLGVYLMILWDREERLRMYFRRDLHAYHALVCASGCSLLLFRYTTSGSRLANDMTLFLELPLIALTILVLLGVVIAVSHVVARIRRQTGEDVFPRMAWAVSPWLLLAPLGLTSVPAGRTIAIVGAITILLLIPATFVRRTIPPSRTRTLVGWLVIPMLLFCLNYATTASSTHWIDLFHRGEALGPASDYLRGKVPYRDVFVLHGLFENGFLDAGLMSVFGREVQVSAMRVIVFDCLGLAAIGILAMAVFNSIPLTLATVAIALVTSVGNQRAVLEILSVAFVVLALRKGRLLPLGVGGAFAALALFYSLETGLYSVTGALLTLVAIAALRRFGATESPLGLGRAIASFLAGFAVAASPVLIYLFIHGAIGDFLRTSFVTIPSMIDAVWSIPYPRVETALAADRSLRAIAEFILGERIRFILNPAVLVLSLAYLVYRASRRNLGTSDQILIALTFTAVLTQRSALGRSDFPHQYFAAFLLAPIMLLLLIALWNELRDAVRAHGFAGRALAASLMSILAVAILTGLWVPDLINSRIDAAAAFHSRMTGVGNPAATIVQDRVDAIRDEVGRLLAPAEPLFDFSNQPALYFFADRPNPTRFYQIPIISPPQFQREVIGVLESTKTKVVLKGSPAGFEAFDGIPNDLRAPAVAAYIDDYYQYATSVRGVELWRRRDSPPPLVLEKYMARHRIPTHAEVGDASRRLLVFPSVASSSGIGGSHWRSDLFLHNASEREAVVQLRYVSGSNAAHRVRLAPRSTVALPDVVGTLLGKPGTVGSLILGSPSSIPVIARVMTYDSSRFSEGSLDPALTIEQSASGEGPLRRLVVPGQPVTAGRRINIDAVNMGESPAVVEFGAFGQDGSPVGNVIPTEIPEQASFRLLDAETHLGVVLDETVVLRITVRRGTVVASASLVQAESGASRTVPAIPVP